MIETSFRISTRMRNQFSEASRKRRMLQFLHVVQPKAGTRVIDLGGVPLFWKNCTVPLEITILNLPGLNLPEIPDLQHTIRLVEGDACTTKFDNNSFDLAFSNSVIEHVGDAENRARMAAEVRRLAPQYWVQTPSIWFPMEAHTMMPFWWFYPAPLRSWFTKRWRRTRPAWTEMIDGTTVIARRELSQLFPDATLLTERTAGFTKSYIACRTAHPGAEREGRRPTRVRSVP